MKLKVDVGSLHGAVDAVPAKAYAHRILICSALCDRPTLITGLFDSEDIVATSECLRACGVKIEDVKKGKLITPPEQFFKSASLDCAESGSTLRFMLPVAAALNINAAFNGRGRLPERPIGELLSVLNASGVHIDNDKLPLKISGALSGDKFTVDGSASSQFVTGMLLALAAMGGRRKLTVSGKKVSGSYIDITADVLSIFGVKISCGDDFTIDCPEKLISPCAVNVEGDWSNSAFWLVSGAIGSHPVTVKGLNRDSVQGDRAITEILQKMNAGIEWQGSSVTAYPSKLKGCQADCSDCPDLVPVLAVAAAFAEGKTVFTGVDRLKIKECDRLQATCDLIKASGIVCSAENDMLTVFGGKPTYAEAVCRSDHRMIMAAAILCSRVGGTLDNVSGVKKSYPHFFDDFKTLGGKYAVSVQ